MNGQQIRESLLNLISYACVCANLLQSCLTLCDPMNDSPPGSLVHGILQARILQWVAVPSSTNHERNAKIKIAVRYHLTPVKMTIFYKRRNNKCWRELEKREYLYTVGGNVNWYNHYGKQYGSSSNKIDYYMVQQSYSQVYISKGIETNISKRYLHTCVHCRILHYSQDMEAIYNSAIKEKGNPVICNSVD